MNNISQLEQAIAIPTAIAGDLTQAKTLIDADKKDEAKVLIDKVINFMQQQADMAKKQMEMIMKKHEEALEVLKKDKHVDLNDPFIMMLNESTYSFKRQGVRNGMLASATSVTRTARLSAVPVTSVASSLISRRPTCRTRSRQ